MITGNDLSMNNSAAAAPLDNAVAIYDPMEIAWSVSPDGGSTWLDAGVSRNPIYVVLNTPDFQFGEKKFHTLFRNSCRDAAGVADDANGQPDKAALLAKVWSDFTDRIVMRADDPVQLTYYANWECGSFRTEDLLASGDGQCGAWATFLLDMLRAHGIDHPNEFVLIYHIANDGDYGFLMNDWNFAPGGGQSGDASYPYLNIPPELPALHFVGNAYVWRYADVTDIESIPGQGPTNPLSWFENHQVVRIGGVYYDPSYGQTYGSLDAIDSGAVAAHYKRETITVVESAIGVDLNSDGDTDDTFDVPAFIIDANPVGNQLEEIIGDYP